MTTEPTAFPLPGDAAVRRPQPARPASLDMRLADEADTVALAEDLAAILRPGDVVALSGDLGAGKTTLARALLRALADDDGLEVPSPTYTLIQPYDLPRLKVAHLDLYRLADEEEMDELGFDDLIAEGAVLVEWPERAGDRLPRSTLWLELLPEPGGGARRAVLTVDGGGWASRLARTLEARGFLDEAGLPHASRRHRAGDASARSFETVTAGRRSGILMNWPVRRDEVPVRDGRSYRQIARIAETLPPFVAVAAALRGRGYSAPEIPAFDAGSGFLLMEDLGRTGIADGEAPVAECYRTAIDLLADFHSRPMPGPLPMADGSLFVPPPYDADAMAIEVSLLPAWYLPSLDAPPPAADDLDWFGDLWRARFEAIATREQHWVLRDFHSPNLIWIEGREGLARLGLIDLQDTVIGPAAYDVASLVQDARVVVPDDLQAELLDRYIAARTAAGPGFDGEAFRADFAVMAAQRATKILGAFVRLDVRDGKPQYLRLLGRIRHYLRSSLSHPVLSDLQVWYETAGIFGPED
ncbi:tRNA (adenosine(37)-N6)-threonylcarbamoyltransferase complex ATPase subunit type 1 TsaE [Pseudoxanthobacter sp.]|uniref:tRNA (adenosine(37)-N6)-threonylcarbamoyltransferase complex ATPase subunit type 1 TsaE n=1 Tax=Pseudoxanthobacter sp. TaxID=1925742 RepID=UPI002FE3EBD0